MTAPSEYQITYCDHEGTANDGLFIEVVNANTKERWAGYLEKNNMPWLTDKET